MSFFRARRAAAFTAVLAAFAVLSLGACSGGGGGAINPPAPRGGNQPQTLYHTSLPMSNVGVPVSFPAVGGFSSTLTVPANNNPTSTLNLTIQTTVPSGMPPMAPNMHVAVPYLYFTLSVSKTVTLHGFPAFSVTIPKSALGVPPVKIGYYDPAGGWQHIGDLVQSGTTWSFAGNSIALTLKAGTVYFAVPYTCTGPSPSPAPSPSPSPTPTGVISCTASGTGAVGVLCVSNHTYGFVGKGPAGVDSVEQVDISTGATSGGSGHVVHTYHSGTVTPYTECSGDETHLRVLCGSFASGELMDINGSSQTGAEFGSGASSFLNFSGGSCVVCAIAFDPTDTAYILLDTTGFQRIGENSHAINMTLTSSDPNENPGYDYVKNRIFSPEYQHNGTVDVADFNTGILYVSDSTFSGIGTEPDSANVDVATHLGVTPDEFDDTVTTIGLSGASFNNAAKTFHATGSSQALASGALVCGGLDYDETAVDSVLHVTFATAEFCSGGSMFFFLLPTTSSGLTISDWAGVRIPKTPDGNFWDSSHDPHQVAAFNDPVNCPDCAIMVNLEATWMAVVDLKKFTKAPRSTSDPHSIDPSYNLLTNHVISFYAI